MNEAISLFFFYRGRDGRRELTAEEVSACCEWMEEHRPTLSQTLQELGCLMALLDQPAPRLSLAVLADQTEDLLAATFGNLLDQDELLHETDPEAWTWPAWSTRHANALLRLLLLTMLQLELGSPRVTKTVRQEFPWPQGLDKTWRAGRCL